MPPRAGQAIALLLLIPLATSLALSFPLLVVLSFTPILGILALSLLLPLSLSLAYLITTILHLLFAPPHTPLSVSFLRQIKVSFYFLSKIRDAFKARLVESAFEYLVQRLVFLRDKGSYTTLKENIIYNPNSSSLPQLLDIYLPPPLKQSSGVSTTSERSTVGVPVIIYLGGGGYRFWTKRAGAQLGRRWAKMGYIVVVPDIRQYAEGNGVTIDEMVVDIRDVLEFVGENIERLANGDPEKIYLLAWGAGTHVSLLTIVQEAIVRSRESLPHLHSASIVPGIVKTKINGEARIPNIGGMILISTICDLSVQLTREHKLGIQDLSALKRITPTSHQSCPSRLLFASKNILDPARLPRKFLFVGGGANRDVGISQSLMCRNLLVGIGGEVADGIEDGEEVGRGKKGSTFTSYRETHHRPPSPPSPSPASSSPSRLPQPPTSTREKGVQARVVLYKDMNHLQSLVAVMRKSKYSDLITREIEEFIQS